MSRTGELYRYDMVVSNPAEFMKQYGDRKMPPDTIVHSLLPEKVREVYAKSHFGFVLRDDVTVNNVACPTKLIEYICFGVLPVMKTTQIGDFVPYGMEYISVEDFEKGHIPSALEFTAKIRRNGEVLKKIQEEFTKGQKALLSFIEGGDEKCQ